MWIFVLLLLVQFAISTALSVLNLAHLKKSAASPPPEWAERLDLSQFPRMIAYMVDKNRLGHAARLVSLAATLAVLLSGLLPALARCASTLAVLPSGLLPGVFQGVILLAVLSAISYLTDLPFDLLSQFGVEKKFGFSTITVKTWLADQFKSLLISAILGVLLGGGLLALIGWLGRWWWLPAWALFSLFELLMMFLAPVLILPLFNKFEPLQDEALGESIMALARQAQFPLAGVFQVDASLRSTHSNAYFTGLGKTRRIALFDTLIAQHTREEILAVLAHEIGHWKKRHILKMFVATTLASGAGFWLVSRLLDLPWLYRAIGAADLYASSGVVGAIAALGMFLVGLLLSPLGLFLSPIAAWVSRRHEYEADAYSLALYPNPTALEDGLIRLNEKNLSNLFPHPLVVLFYYSHPPLLQRVAAIRAAAIRAKRVDKERVDKGRIDKDSG
ncbi:MAG: M48 family metallopeptidase [Anaerolineae bacterium]|nr:M48 family metallopeptidase [Anaerolineae bacterium]